MILKNSIVVVAMYCCGKSYACNHNNSKYSMIEIENEALKIYHRFCIKDHIECLKESLGKYDIIFVIANKEILNFLRINKIPYCLSYIDNTREGITELRKRNLSRKDASKWCVRQLTVHANIECLKHDNYALHHFILNKDQYLSDIIDEIVSVCSQSIL